MQISEGKKIQVPAPKDGFKKDVPVLVGSLVVVPRFHAKEGSSVTCTYTGHFDGPIKPGDSPVFTCEPAYLEEGVFTKTQPKTGLTQSVGVFVDGGVLLTGELISV